MDNNQSAAHESSIHRLGSGLQITVRPVRPSDAEHIRAAIVRADRASIYQRFFTHHPPVNDAAIKRLAEVDYVHRLALVAEVDSQPVAIARYESLPGTDEVEIAFAVDPDFRGHGIASLLGRMLIDQAATHGKTRVVAYHLAENDAAARLLAGLGLEPGKPEHAVVESSMDLSPIGAGARKSGPSDRG